MCVRPEFLKTQSGAKQAASGCRRNFTLVSARCGVTRATALHMAARRGYVGIASALLDCGAAMDAKDDKGDTPLQRAINCRRDALA
jgi:ankyrin repeat protein